jgi:hypothetical protein
MYLFDFIRTRSSFKVGHTQDSLTLYSDSSLEFGMERSMQEKRVLYNIRCFVYINRMTRFLHWSLIQWLGIHVWGE